MEGQARQIFTYEKGIFPGLLQSADYAEALIAACDGVWWESSYTERTNRVSFRLRRQELVFGAIPPKELKFIFTEDALLTEFGRPEVMRRQLEHVRKVVNEHPNVNVRILKMTVRDSPAPHGGFTTMHFVESSPPVGFVSVAYGPSPYLDEPVDIQALDRVFARLQDLALSQEDSLELIEETLGRI